MCFFDIEGLINTNYVPSGKTVNTNKIVEALSWFLGIFKKKQLKMVAGEWFWDNSPFHTSDVVKEWMAARPPG